MLFSTMRRGRDNEAIYWFTQAAGTYYVLASFAQKNSYTLQLTLQDGPCTVPCGGEGDDTCMPYGMRCSPEQLICVPF